jgi:hypothetical protein
MGPPYLLNAEAVLETQEKTLGESEIASEPQVHVGMVEAVTGWFQRRPPARLFMRICCCLP